MVNVKCTKYQNEFVYVDSIGLKMFLKKMMKTCKDFYDPKLDSELVSIRLLNQLNLVTYHATILFNLKKNVLRVVIRQKKKKKISLSWQIRPMN